MGIVDSILPQEGIDKAVGYGGMGFSMLRNNSINPLNTLGGLGGLMFARPGARIRQAKAQKNQLLGKASAQVEKNAFWRTMKRTLSRGAEGVYNFLLPETRQLAESATASGARQWRSGLGTPAKVLGGTAALYGGVKALDYFDNQADMVNRARSYRVMMNKYGPELRAYAEQNGQPLDDEKIRDLYNALYKAAPDVAKEPTLAATQMAPLIKETASPNEGTQLSFPETGLHMIEPATNVQKGIPKRFRPSDVIVPGQKMMDSIQRYDPYQVAAQQAAGMPGKRNEAMMQGDVRDDFSMRGGALGLQNRVGDMLDAGMGPDEIRSLLGL